MKITELEYMQMYNIIGACMTVHKELGRGMEEPIYQEALMMELEDLGIEDVEREKVLHTYYKGRKLKKIYEADFYVNGIIVELKSVNQINSEHRAQLINYMRITKSVRGLLINFGEKRLHTERFLFDQENDDIILLNESNINEYVDRLKIY